MRIAPLPTSTDPTIALRGTRVGRFVAHAVDGDGRPKTAKEIR